MRKTLAVLTLLPALSIAAAQTTADHRVETTSVSTRIEEIASPMVLDVALGSAGVVFTDQWQEHTDMSRFRCRGVSVESVRVKGYRPKRDPSGRLKVDYVLAAIAGHDKSARPLLELLVDGSTVDRVEGPHLQVEESDTNDDSVTFKVPPDKIDSEQKMVLRITLSVKG